MWYVVGDREKGLEAQRWVEAESPDEALDEYARHFDIHQSLVEVLAGPFDSMKFGQGWPSTGLYGEEDIIRFEAEEEGGEIFRELLEAPRKKKYKQKCTTGMEVQSILVDLTRIDIDEAVDELKADGWATSKRDYNKDRTHVRFRQRPPERYSFFRWGKEDEFGTGIKPLYACPKEGVTGAIGDPTGLRRGDLVNFQEETELLRGIRREAFDDDTLLGVFLEERDWGYVVDTPSGKQGVTHDCILAERFIMEFDAPEFEAWLDANYPAGEGEMGATRAPEGEEWEALKRKVHGEREMMRKEKEPLFIPEHVVQAFIQLGQRQLEHPERAMVRAQRVLGPSYYAHAIEHVGDITHRMTEQIGDRPEGGGWAGGDNVRHKAGIGLKTLRHPDGVDHIFRQQMAATARHDGVTLEEQIRRADDALRAYANAHRELRVYNRAQWLARESAVALGERRYKDAERHLSELHALTDDYEKQARDFWLDPVSGNLMTYPHYPGEDSTEVVFPQDV